MPHRKMPLIRAVLFCLLCAIALASFSGLTKNLLIEWKQHFFLVLTIAITYVLTLLFTKWEKLHLKNVGVAPNKKSFKKIVIGFGIGIVMAFFQLGFVFVSGHYKVALISSISSYNVIFYLALYILLAVREELAFRGYPLFNLNRSYGLWASQLIILVIFSLEHVAGGMTWASAFLGAGTGALLFGLAAIRTNGIALPIGLHAAWNFGQWCLGLKNETGLLHGITEIGFEHVVERNGWIGYLVIMAIAIVAFYFYRPKSIGKANMMREAQPHN